METPCLVKDTDCRDGDVTERSVAVWIGPKVHLNTMVLWATYGQAVCRHHNGLKERANKNDDKADSDGGDCTASPSLGKARSGERHRCSQLWQFAPRTEFASRLTMEARRTELLQCARSPHLKSTAV